jgi:ElaA protein
MGVLSRKKISHYFRVPHLKINWQWKCFNELTTHALYAILKLRADVFIIEQQDFYQDADGKDIGAWHLCGYSSDDDLIAYARLIYPGDCNQPVNFGRVIVKQNYRGRGIAKELAQCILDKVKQSEFKNYRIEISAQAHLKNFYASFGFHQDGEPYYDGNILHIHMAK